MFLFKTDCEEHRHPVNYQSLMNEEYSVTNEADYETPMDIFSGSGAQEPQDIPDETLTLNFDLRESGIKKLISLSFMGENIKLIKVTATKDSVELTQSEEHVRIVFINCQKTEH